MEFRSAGVQVVMVVWRWGRIWREWTLFIQRLQTNVEKTSNSNPAYSIFS